MKCTKIILGSVLLSSMVLGSPAFAGASDKQDKSDMPMMDSGQPGSTMGSGQQGGMAMSAQGDMSKPMMQMMMMQMMQMMMQQNGNKMSMHGGQGGHQGGHQGSMGMMSKDGGGMPMMQEKQAQMKQHMQSMESKLGNIEALLQQLVDLQKSN